MSAVRPAREEHRGRRSAHPGRHRHGLALAHLRQERLDAALDGPLGGHLRAEVLVESSAVSTQQLPAFAFSPSAYTSSTPLVPDFPAFLRNSAMEESPAASFCASSRVCLMVPFHFVQPLQLCVRIVCSLSRGIRGCAKPSGSYVGWYKDRP